MSVQLSIPSRPEYIPTVRLVTAAIANKEGFDVETVDDLRVCVSEAINYLFAYNQEIQITIEEGEDRMVLQISARLGERPEDGQLQEQIMESLMDQVEISEEGIRLTKFK